MRERQSTCTFLILWIPYLFWLNMHEASSRWKQMKIYNIRAYSLCMFAANVLNVITQTLDGSSYPYLFWLPHIACWFNDGEMLFPHTKMAVPSLNNSNLLKKFFIALHWSCLMFFLLQVNLCANNFFECDGFYLEGRHSSNILW